MRIKNSKKNGKIFFFELFDEKSGFKNAFNALWLNAGGNNKRCLKMTFKPDSPAQFISKLVNMGRDICYEIPPVWMFKTARADSGAPARNFQRINET